MEQHGFSRESRTKRHGASVLATLRALHDLLKDEHHGRGRHVAVVSQNIARVRERVGGQFKALFHSIENGAASGMDRPEIDGAQILSASDLASQLLERAANFTGD